MNFLLDTSVVSEWVKLRPDPGVVAWLAELDEDRAFISVISLAELRYGAARLAAGARRRHLEAWLRHDLPLRFERRILAVDEHVAEAWGNIVARRDAAGRPIGAMDALLAATAAVHGLALVTRDTSGFAAAVEAIINPWRDEAT